MSGPGSKRAAGDGGSGPPEKKANREEKTTTTLIEPIRLGGISSTEEMDLKVLQFKNKKLAERLEQRQAFEDELRERIEKLEKRQATDDATLLIVNRYWSQLDENVQVLLRGYDGDCEPQPPAAPSPPSAEEPRPEPMGQDPENTASPGTEGPDRTETAPPIVAPSTSWKAGGLLLNEPALSFLATLASSSSEEIELQLQERMEFSKAAVSRVVEVSNKIHRRTEELCQKIHACADLDQLDEALKSLNKELMRENQRLQDLAMQLQEKHHKISLEYTELQDKVTSSETKVLEMETTVEDLQWDIEKLRKREQKLNKHLAEALEQLNSGYYVSGSSGGFQGGQITLSMQKFEMLNAELEENQELANSRMAELEKLQQELQQAVRTNEKLKVALRSLPEEAVKETLDYKVLQSQFSLLYNESLQVKTQLDEARALLLTTKNSHLRHIEHMESDELNLQKKLRTEVIQLEDTLAQVRKEYEMLRIEFEQNLAANEQAGPINREMRHLISSLQNHNHQLKGDVQRYKRKLREVQAEINKVRDLLRRVALNDPLWGRGGLDWRKDGGIHLGICLAATLQVDAQLLVVQKLEEKERVLQGNLGTVEKELTLRSQALELNKRKAVEAAQLAEDLKVQQEHVQCKLKEIQACMAENRAAKEKESFNLKRAQEDISRLRRKLEKQKKVEVYADADEILQEEIKEYKAKLTCPCCNTRKKDAVLTKCFHVFCLQCAQTRYDTRQRKCPKCNAAFGANDFHRIYIS
ncbi:E3 ubiquitin-protein ligase BRE1B [Chelonoidis abingdonii]|uniref:E3 ubiquitin-protein ligase BRE1B n=1 Tax=Chelonoidis abingdonii TaxID=106734 RepID=UPI003F492D22